MTDNNSNRELRQKRQRKEKEVKRQKTREKWNSMSKRQKTWRIIFIILSVLFVVLGIVFIVIGNLDYAKEILRGIGCGVISIGLFLSIVQAVIGGQKFGWYIQRGWGQIAFIMGGMFFLISIFNLFLWYVALIILCACVFIPEILREKR